MSNTVLEKSRILLEDVASLFGAKKGADCADHPEPRRVLELTGLEDRLLFSATPISPEMIEGAGGTGIEQEPAVAPDADGALVVGWGTENLDGDDWGLASEVSYEETTQEDDSSLSNLTPEDTLQQLAEGPNAATNDGDDFVFQWDADADANLDSGEQTADALVRRELVFVDTGAEDYELLLDDLLGSDKDGRSFEVVLLDSSRDGIEQISEILAGSDDLDAVHIVSHGTGGGVQLGNTWLQLDNLDGYASAIAGWGQALDAEADLLIYGCELAANDEGRTLVETLSALTGADAAASTDDTGHAALGGDWELEYRAGGVETGVVFSIDVQQEWRGVLAAFAVDTVDDTADANPGDGNALDAFGNTSLRAAIEEANALGGANTISLGAGTFTLSLGELSISSDITITGAGAGQTIIDGNALSRIFHISGGSTVVISDVTIQNGDSSGSGNGGGIWIDDPADNVTLNRVIITGNTADTGGGIYNQGATLTFTDGEISGNFAVGGGQSGGGLDNEGITVLDRVTVWGNTAATGGGIYNGAAGASLTLTNATISANDATNGGGLYTTNTATLTNVTITNNDATNGTGGSGIHRAGGSGTVTLTNTIVAGNTTTADMLGTSYASGGNNLIGDKGNATDFVDGVNGDQVGDSGSPLDPLLGALADNGGYTQTHALQTGSTAINAGNSGLAPTADQRGTSREGTADIGAYEYITIADSTPPSQVYNSGSVTPKGNSNTILDTELRFDDTEQPATSVTYTVTSGLANGQLELTTDPGTAVTSFTQDDIDNNRLIYVHDNSATTSDSFTFTVDDGQGNSVTGQTFNITVTTADVVLTVTNTDNSGVGTLRQAIIDANASGQFAFIDFAIGASGAQTIQLQSALDPITSQVTIDGSTQSGYTGTPLIELDGNSAGAGVDGLRLIAGSAGSTIRGLAIYGFAVDGIEIDGSDSNTIAGNFIGTDSSGTLDLGNGVTGIFITNGASSNTVGGLTAAERNVISGNGNDGLKIEATAGSANTVIGNYIGLDSSGTSALGNGGSGIDVQADGSIIGGTAAGSRNVVADSNYNGIVVSGNNNTIQGNYIGTDVSGTTDFGNGRNGIWINGGSGNLVGGMISDAGNLIHGNGRNGVHVSEGTPTGNAILGNSISGNDWEGIDLSLTRDGDGVSANDGSKPATPNLGMDFPVFTSVVLDGTSLTVSGYVGSAPGQSTFANARVEIFKSDDDAGGYGQGQTYLGFLTTDASGNISGSITVAGLNAGDKVTGTATDGSNNTSEFGGNVIVSEADTTAPTQVNNTGSTVDEGGTDTISSAELRYDDAEQPAASVTYTVTSGLANGQLELTTDPSTAVTSFTQDDIDSGRLVYVHNDTETPSDSFNFTVDDGQGNSVTGQYFAITVTPVNDNPVVNDDSYDVDEDGVLTVGDGSLTPHTVSTAADSPYAVYAKDIDGDGDMDLLSASNGSGTVDWHENDGSQNFTTHTITATASGADEVYAEDVDGDGDMDVLSASWNDHTIAWYENDGSQNFTARVISSTATNATSVHAADVDDDGDMDVVSTSWGDGTIAWYENDGAENFTLHVITSAAAGAGWARAEDLDSDGDVDVVATWGSGSTTAWFENDGSENFTLHTITNAAVSPRTGHVADVDGDSDLDLLLASSGDNTVAWYENDGSQNFTGHNISTTADTVRSVYAADMDGDGDVDVLSASPGDNTFTWYENDGSQNFNAHAISTTAAGASWVVAADVDGDADIDVVSASNDDDTVAWYENDGFGVLFNDTDVDGDPLTAILVGGPIDGNLTLNPDGSFTYTPDPDFSGTDTFTYQANDGTNDSNIAMVTITINPVNDAPTVVGESFTAVEGIPFTSELGLNDLLLNDTDVDGDTLSVNTTPITGPANGALVLNTDGTFTYTPNASFNGTDSFVYEVTDGNGGTVQATATITVHPREIRILFTTQSDVNNSKVPGISSWDAGDVLGIGDPNLSFEPAGSDGSVLPYMDLEALSASGDMTINGLHFVSNDITVGGANSVDLKRGDLLFVSDSDDVMTSTNSLAVTDGDVIAFRPAGVDDYSSGTFIHLLDQPGTAKTTGITLVEKDVLVGDVTLPAGTFLFTQESVDEESSIYHFSADDVGAGTTTGTVSTLISSVDIDVNWNNFVGVMLVSEDLYLDGAMVPAGSIVTTLAGGDSFVGDNSIEVNEDEIFYLTVTSTTMGSGTTSADATILFDGGDIGLNSAQKKMRNLAIIEKITVVDNVDPVITLSGGGLNYTELDPPTIIDGAATLTDPDSANFDVGLLRVDLDTTGSADDRLAIRHQGTAAGQVGISGSTVTYGGVAIGTFTGGTDGSDPLTVSLNANADVAAVEAVIRNVTFENVSSTPSTTQRSVRFTVSDGDGGTSGVVAKTIVINDVNSAPVLTGANDLNAIDEDAFNNGGTLVSGLISGWVTDADQGALAGIAVVGVDNTHGSWEFSTDGGSTWTAFGSPSTNAARLLTTNPDTFVRFVPEPNWNGSVTDGITFHAWDQSDGVNGDKVDLLASGNLRDQFDTVSYASNDGSALWTSDWVEFEDDSSAASGNIRVESGKLHLDNLDGGALESITRSADLANAASATLTFDYDGFGEGGLDIVAFEVSSDGGSTWTLLESMELIGNISGSKSYDLESFTALTADMQVRFRIVQGLGETTQHINFDNVDIIYSGTGIGGSSSVSTATASSSITVNSVNDAPQMTAWFDDAWTGRKALTIDASQVVGDVADFPVLISLNVDTELAAQALANGDDIVFTATDGVTQLAHEIEHFDEATGALRAWVKTDLSASVDTAVYMYYGNAAATNQENAPGVWGSNYVGVYHLNEAPAGTPGEIVDSSGSGNHAVTEGSMDASDSVVTAIGTGLAFDGGDDKIRISDSASLDGLNDAATFTLWINWVDAADGDHQIIMTSENRFSGGDGYEWASQGDGDHFFYPDATSPDGNYNLGPNPFTNGQWHHLAATMDFTSKEVKIYVDGNEMTFNYEGVPTKWTELSDSGDLLWGGNPDRASRYFLGMMDEIRLADTVRSQQWIQTEVNNQTNAGAFLSVGAVELPSTQHTLTDIDEDDYNSPGDSVLTIIASVGGDRITDADTGAVEGIAVVGVDDTNGQWQYDANADGTWVAFGNVDDASAVLLDTDALVRFVPDADYHGTAGDLTFRAWDQSFSSHGDTAVDVSTNGGTTAFSSVIRTATVTVLPVGDAPTGSVTISGTATEDQTLTAGNTLADADGLGTISYQWQRDGIDIAGATGGNYTLTQTDVGTTITVVASYTDGDGTNESVNSAGFGPVANSNDPPTGSVFISGTPTEDQTLNASNTLADEDGLGTISYQWQRDGVDIAGATSGTYALTQADVGTTITVVASYTDGQGANESVTSAGVGPVANLNDAPTGSVTISGTPTEDQVLTAANTLVDEDGLGPISYQWQRDGVDIGGATSSTYTLTQADVGTTITVVASYTDVEGTAESVSSAGVGPIAKVNDPPVANNDAVVANEDTPLLISAASLLTNDADVDLDVLSITNFTQPASGSVVDNGDGTFTYAPIANFNGADSFTYTVSDGNGGTDTATVNITVAPVNDNPVATGDNYTIIQGDTLSVPASGVLANDTDVEGDPLTVAIVGGPANGTLTLNSDGSFSYTPNAGFSGSDSFSYAVDDGSGGNSVASVTVDVQVGGLPPTEPVEDTPPEDEPTDSEEPSDETDDPATEEDGGANGMAPAPPTRTDRLVGLGRQNITAIRVGEDIYQNRLELDDSASSAEPDETAESVWLSASKSSGGERHFNRLEGLVQQVVDFDVSQLWHQFDTLADDLQHDTQLRSLALVGTVGLTTAATAGYAIWALRSGYFVMTALASIPSWKSFDLVPILDFKEREHRERKKDRKADHEHPSWTQELLGA